MASPLPHQLPALARHVLVLAGSSASLEGSVPGFGKTFVACFLAQYLKRKIAVLCPKSTIPSWRRAAADVGVEVIFITNPEQAKLEKFQHGEWVIRGRRYAWNLPKDTLLVFDECHRFSDRTTQNSKMMTAARIAGTQGVKILAMSATAARDPLDLYSLGYILGVHQGQDFIGWAMNYGVRRGHFAFEFKGGSAELLKLHRLLYPDHGYRASYDDIPGFPENTITTVPVEVATPSSVDKLFDRAQELELLEGSAQEAVVARLRARQHAELCKVPHFIELIKDHKREGMSVAVFVNFTDTLNELVAAFPDASVVRGGQSESVRQRMIDNFQEDRSRIVLNQSAAGGIGVNYHDTHGNFPRVSIISPPESARMLIQILGRIHRTGAKSPALQKIVFAENTVEKRVRATVDRNVRHIDLINDGDLDPVDAFIEVINGVRQLVPGLEDITRYDVDQRHAARIAREKEAA